MGLTSSTISNPDFVVVGGGSAGCVVASRLSENPNVTVVLVEAGGSDDQFNINTPLASKLLQGSNVDWAYKTAPQEHACLAHNERRSAWPRGRVLGGCSSINYMAYVRGNKADYDLWAELGCDGWAYNDVLPYFLKSEKQTAPRLAESKYHSTQGPMGVSDLKHTNILSRTFVDACEEVGIPKTEDYNGENQLGAGMCQATQLNGERVTTARAFLRSVGKRPNLSILTNAQVTRILFNENKEATGIAYVLGKGKPEQTLLAKKEVILSAGAVGSPHILLLSGVGPQKHLEEMGIPVVADLPVGENLQDHLVVPLPFLSDLDGYFEPKVNTVGNLLSYVTSKSGPFSSNGLECTAFVQTGKSPELGGAPDIQMHLFAAIGDKKDVVNFNYIPASINQEMLKKPLNGMTLLAVLLHPRSKGRVTLSSKDPLAHPVLDPHYLEDPHDVEVLVEGCKLAARIAGAQAYVNAGANLKAISMLEKFCEHPVGSDEYLADYTRRTASTLYHPIGTCRMGPADAPSSVVDPRCRVLGGIKRLRVIDASIMPTLPSGNTNAPAIMVGERGVEFVIKDL